MTRTSHTLATQIRNWKPFSYLTDAQFSNLLDSSLYVNAPAGTMLIHQDEQKKDFLVLFEGELEIRRRFDSPGHVEQLAVGRIYPGQGVGEFALLMGVTRQASVLAVLSSKILRIDGEKMEEMLAWSQHFNDELRKTANARVRMNLVRQAGPFRQLPLDRLRDAFDLMQTEEYEAKTTVMHEGENGDRYYIIESGTAEVWRKDPVSNETTLVATLGSGDGFGEEALLLNEARNATVIFTSRGKLLSLSRDDFDQMMRPQMVFEIEAKKALQMVEQGEAYWVDCRYPIEYNESHIPGASNLPLDKLRELSATLDPSRPYIVYCRSGRRSIAGVFLLRERGLTAYTLIGGLLDWPYALDVQTADKK